MNIDDLYPELKEKAYSSRTAEELRELLKEEGMEITDEELGGIAGGAWCNAYYLACPGQCEEYVKPNCKK